MNQAKAEQQTTDDTTPQVQADKTTEQDKQTKEQEKKKAAEEKEKGAPEEIKRPAVPATFRGWKEVSGWRESDTLTAEDELDDLLSTPTSLENYLPEVAYGDWYHNVGVLFLGGFLSWFFGWFGFSLAPVFFVIVITTAYYRTQIRKYRSRIKEGTQREMSVKRIETDYETMDWLNALLDKYWIYLEPYVCQQVADNVNPIIATSIASLPAFINSVWIDCITLGSKPFRVESVKTLPETSDDVLVMDWCCSFTPNDYHDLTYKQLKNRVSQKVVIKIKVFGIPIPIVVKNVAFKATVRVRIHLMESFPHVDTVNISLPELPMFDFVTKLLGDTVFNWEVLSFPGLWPFIYEMIQKYAGPLVLPPFSFQLNVEQLLAGDINAASGILALTVHRAENIKLFDRTLDNTIDPYITFGFNNEVSAKTTTLQDTKLPKWDETLFILVKNMADPLRMIIYDYNDDRKDGQIGIIDYDLQTLKDEPERKNIHERFMRNNKAVGDLNFSFKYMPAILPKRLIDGSTEPPPELNTGIVRIEIGQATFDSDTPVTASVEFNVNHKNVAKTSVFKKNNEPSYGITTRHAITNRANARVALLLKDANGKEINSIHSSLNDLIDRTVIGKPSVSFKDGLGKVDISAFWQPVKIDSVSGALSYTDPIGVVKVIVSHARDLRNLETVGTIDPYTRVLVNGFAKSRTTFKDSTTNPDWNEALWVPVTSVNQKLTLEVMDVETHNDRSLGAFDVKLTDIITRDEKGELTPFEDKEPRTNRLVAKRFSKGSITYSISFYPLQKVLDIDEEKQIEQRSQELAAAREKEATLSAKEKKLKEEHEKEEQELAKFDEAIPLAPPVGDFSKTDKHRVTLEELVAFESGVFVFKILGVQIAQKKGYLQAFFDAGGYSELTSPKLTRENSKFTGNGDVVIKELSWSETVFRLAEDKDHNRAEDPLAEVSIPTLNLLKNAYYEPFDLKLNDGSVVTLKARFIPTVLEELPESDRIISSGTLSVDIHGANNLISADSNGKSDPFCRLLLNGTDEVFKTKTKKRTLDPHWNETTSFEVFNRYYAFLKIAVFDWDFGAGQDDELGEFDFPLSEVKSDGTPTEVEVKLAGKGGIPNGGVVKLTFRFKPGYIIPVKKDERSLTDNAVFDTGKTFVAGGGKVIGGGVGVVGKVKNSIFSKKG